MIVLRIYYEKVNIDEIILDRAKESQTVMFGEIHATIIDGYPPPVEDSRYVVSLLKRLKAIGYDYLALEVKESSLPGSHSHDLIRFFNSYTKGKPVSEEQYPFAKPGWIELMTAVLEYQYKLVCIDRSHAGENRDAAMFHAVWTDIFDHDPDAKVLVYIGANHISVYMGYPQDTPIGCDLFISHFIWNTYRNLITTSHLDHPLNPYDISEF